ncbi:hypothetical protein [Pedomonas sp. V897]|uniref:hypothetical protein n=1 Tax=Pedomonas sp. V897 TaxID=3446482 RepID=UPI003EE05F96
MIWVIRLCLFFLPFLLFWAWLRWSGRLVGPRRIGLFALVAGLLVATLLGLGLAASLTQSGAPGDRYIPAYEQDGRIIEGRFEKPGNE